MRTFPAQHQDIKWVGIRQLTQNTHKMGLIRLPPLQAEHLAPYLLVTQWTPRRRHSLASGVEIMKREEILRERWQDFCNEFSRRHKGWLVTLDVVEKTPRRGRKQTLAGEHILANDMPLKGIAVEQKGEETFLFVTVGDDRDRITHRVADPSAVFLEQTDDEEHTCLNISGGGDQTTLICFQDPTAPKRPGGFAESER